jgi:hypothetical protein
MLTDCHYALCHYNECRGASQTFPGSSSRLNFPFLFVETKVDHPKPENDDFADELIEKIEILTGEKSELVRQLEASKDIQGPML